jgi:hypothetical protein
MRVWGALLGLMESELARLDSSPERTKEKPMRRPLGQRGSRGHRWGEMRRGLIDAFVAQKRGVLVDVMPNVERRRAASAERGGLVA